MNTDTAVLWFDLGPVIGVKRHQIEVELLVESWGSVVRHVGLSQPFPADVGVGQLDGKDADSRRTASNFEDGPLAAARMSLPGCPGCSGCHEPTRKAPPCS